MQNLEGIAFSKTLVEPAPIHKANQGHWKPRERFAHNRVGTKMAQQSKSDPTLRRAVDRSGYPVYRVSKRVRRRDLKESRKTSRQIANRQRCYPTLSHLISSVRLQGDSHDVGICQQTPGLKQRAQKHIVLLAKGWKTISESGAQR